MAQSGMLTIVERTQIRKTFDEVELRASDLVEQDQAVESGKLVGADHVVIGGFAYGEGGLKVTARMVAVETGLVTIGVVEEGRRERKVLDAVAAKLLDHLGIAATYNEGYRRQRILALAAGATAIALGGVTAWSHSEYKQADEEYSTSYHFDAARYAEAGDRAEAFLNVRAYSAGGAGLLAATSVVLLLTNRVEWTFAKKKAVLRLTPYLDEDSAGIGLAVRF
jgi:hypothetical protein